jgi:hypothetical protein
MKSFIKPLKENIVKLLLLIITDLIIPIVISIINNDNKYIILINIISFVFKIFS